MDVVTPVRQLPMPGETILVGDVTLVPGGKGANAAVAAARMGGEVRFVGCVGADAFGEQLLSALKEEGIDTQSVAVSSKSTGTAVILLDQVSGQNSILVGPGANVEVKAPDDSEWYAWGDILMLQLEIPVATVLLSAQRARQQGVLVMLDPAPASANLPAELLTAVDILVPNETELATLTGRPVESLEQIEAAGRALIADSGVKELVVTLGSRGVLWINAETTQHIETIAVEVVDSTAAGDTFAGALAVALAKGTSMVEALLFATTAGSLACTRLGAQSSIPDLSDVLERSRTSIEKDVRFTEGSLTIGVDDE